MSNMAFWLHLKPVENQISHWDSRVMGLDSLVEFFLFAQRESLATNDVLINDLMVILFVRTPSMWFC